MDWPVDSHPPSFFFFYRWFQCIALTVFIFASYCFYYALKIFDVDQYRSNTNKRIVEINASCQKFDLEASQMTVRSLKCSNQTVTSVTTGITRASGFSSFLHRLSIFMPFELEYVFFHDDPSSFSILLWFLAARLLTGVNRFIHVAHSIERDKELTHGCPCNHRISQAGFPPKDAVQSPIVNRDAQNHYKQLPRKDFR